MEIEMEVLPRGNGSGFGEGEASYVSMEGIGEGEKREKEREGVSGSGEMTSDGLGAGESLERKRKHNGNTQLVIHNTAWKSWIPAVGSALLLVSLGIFFLFIQFEAWTVHSIVSLVLVANGLVLLTKTRKETCTFDQAKGKLTIRRTSWRGRKVTRHWLMQIKEVRVEEYKDPQGGTDYELYLFLRSGQRVKIFSGHLIGVGSKRKLQARDEIVEFLDQFSKKYTTKSRASHSGLKGYMKKQLSGALMPQPRISRRRGRSASFTRGQQPPVPDAAPLSAGGVRAGTGSGGGVGLGTLVPGSPKRKRTRSRSFNPGISPPNGRGRASSDATPPPTG